MAFQMIEELVDANVIQHKMVCCCCIQTQSIPAAVTLKKLLFWQNGDQRVQIHMSSGSLEALKHSIDGMIVQNPIIHWQDQFIRLSSSAPLINLTFDVSRSVSSTN